jgi:hypothetical protein
LKDELKTDAGTYSGELGGDIYRAKCRCGRDRFSILASFNVERVVDIFHIDDWVSFGLVLA